MSLAMRFAVLSCLLCRPAFSFDLLERQMDSLARNLIANVKMEKDDRIFVLERDNANLINVDFLFGKLQERIHAYKPEVRLNKPSALEHSIIRSAIMSNGSLNGGLKLIKDRPRMLFQFYFYVLGKTLTYRLDVMNLTGQNLHRSGEYQIETSYSASLGMELKDYDSTKINYINQSDRKIRSDINPLYAAGGKDSAVNLDFEFSSEWVQAQQWMIPVVKDLLVWNYGLRFGDSSAKKVILKQGGDLLIKTGKSDIRISSLVEKATLLNDSYPEEKNRYYARSAAAGLVADTFVTLREKAILAYMKRIIFDSLADAYNNFNLEYLQNVYADYPKNPNILVGHLDSVVPAEGKEFVSYKWKTKSEYLGTLADEFRQGRRFRVDMTWMGVFKDVSFPGRWWVVLKQNWKSLNGRQLAYQDAGFLLLHFDFKEGSAADSRVAPSQFKISHRLWFYDYCLLQNEPFLRPKDKLERDLNEYFMKPIEGIHASLMADMKTFILGKVRTFAYPLR